MKCSKCQCANPEGAKFCIECGNPIELHCPKCDAITPAQGKFCMECGHSLARPVEGTKKELSFAEKITKIQRYLPEGLTQKILSQRDRIEGERKQVTVMFCDMEGFTALTENIGPEEAYSIMDQVYEILIHKVNDYEGTVNEMTGDGVMALFGAPIALEDAPQRAIRAAYSIHREMLGFNAKITQEQAGIPSLRMRIGIHTGAAVVGTLGNDLRVEFKAVGDTVNLASRVEELAEPGATYVTEDTFKLTEGLFRFEALGKREIKGKREPIPIYRVIAPSTRKTRFDVSAERGLTPFVGRERELELLLDGFTRVKGGRGQAFSVIAEAGVGKSRLLYEFRKAIANEDVSFLEGKCLSYSRGITYHPIIDVLKSNFDLIEADRDSEIKDKVKRGLQRLRSDEASTLPYVLQLLSVRDSGIDGIPISPDTMKDRIQEAITRIVIKGSEIRPLILAIEDLHWIDKSSEECLKFLLENIAGARVLLVFTYRPEFVHIWGMKSYHSQLNLNRLSNRESLAMVTHLLGTEHIESALEELILEKTEGVPFFIEEFMKSLRDLRIIERKDAAYRLVKDIQTIAIPSTIQDVIMARMDSLPEEAKEVLQIGSVVGREFTHDLIGRVMGLSEQELLSRLSASKDSELLYERGIYPESAYVFKHAFTQEVAYESLLVKKRKEVHEKIGRTIELIYGERLEEFCEMLAYHYVRSFAVDKAVEYLDLANQKAAKVCAMDDAKGYFEEAMKLLDTLPETEANRERRITLLVNQYLVFLLLFKLPDYHQLLMRYEPMALALDNPHLLGPFYTRMGHCDHGFANFDQSIQRLEKGAELCELTRKFEDAAFGYALLGWNHFWKGNYDRALGLKQKALLSIPKKLYPPRWHMMGLSMTSWSYSNMGRWNEALEEAQEALSVAEKSSDNSLISFASWIMSIAYNQLGDLGRAVEYAEDGLQKAPTLADKAWAQRHLAWAWCRAGKTEKGIELLEALATIFRAGGYKPFELNRLLWLGEGYWLAGDYDKARQPLEDCLEMAESSGARFQIGSANRILGEIELKIHADEAAVHFDKSIIVLNKIKAENQLALAYAGYGRLHKEQGNMREARKYFEKALEIFNRLGTLIEPDKVRAELAELSVS